MAFNRTRGFLSGSGPSPCSLSICLWYFHFYKAHGPTPAIFAQLDSHPLYQMDYLRDRRACCASDSLGILGMLDCCILGVPCPPFRQLHMPRSFVVGGLLCLHWAFSGTLAWGVPGLLLCALLVHSGSFLGGPYPHPPPQICLLHQLGVLPLSGFYFWCHLGSRFIVHLHCGGFNRGSLVARLLGPSLAPPVI